MLSWCCTITFQIHSQVLVFVWENFHSFVSTEILDTRTEPNVKTSCTLFSILCFPNTLPKILLFRHFSQLVHVNNQDVNQGNFLNTIFLKSLEESIYMKQLAELLIVSRTEPISTAISFPLCI